MRTMQACLEAYIASIYQGDEVQPDQLREVSRAFYAGAKGMFKVLEEISCDKSISEDAGEAILRGIRDELRAYASQVLRGEA